MGIWLISPTRISKENLKFTPLAKVFLFDNQGISEIVVGEIIVRSP